MAKLGGAKKPVLQTGAMGSMGSATLRELLDRRDRFNIVVLARDTVLENVTGADVVLRIAALISPAADRHPSPC